MSESVSTTVQKSSRCNGGRVTVFQGSTSLHSFIRSNKHDSLRGSERQPNAEPTVTNFSARIDRYRFDAFSSASSRSPLRCLPLPSLMERGTKCGEEEGTPTKMLAIGSKKGTPTKCCPSPLKSCSRPPKACQLYVSHGELSRPNTCQASGKSFVRRRPFHIAFIRVRAAGSTVCIAQAIGLGSSGDD